MQRPPPPPRRSPSPERERPAAPTASQPQALHLCETPPSLVPPPALATPGYTIGEVLHTSSTWQLVRATAHDDGRPVLLRRPRVAGPLRRAELHHELALAARLVTVDLLRPLAVARDGDDSVLVYEFFAGRPLSLGTGPTRSPGELRALAVRLCHALDGMHRAGVVHKNLHPGAVLVDDAGQLRLTDLALASVLSREEATIDPPSRVRGELPYLAPEQSGRMNRAIDARSDLYSLGVILYEQLAGALPFQQKDPLELIHAHMTALPAALPAQVPSDLAAIVLRLLAKNPEDRPQDAQELLHLLLDDSGLVAPSQPFRLPQKLYGRDLASAALTAGFRRAAAGACVFALVSGYAGIGKSSLVQELHRPLTASRGFFAAGKFDQYNRGVPFAAVIAAAATLLQHVLTLGPREISSWQLRIAQAVGTALPVLAEIVPDVQAIVGPQPPASPLPTTEAQQRLQITLQRFIGVFTAEAHPLVLFFDDLQWADGATLRLIDALVGEPSTHHLLLLGAYRDHELGPSDRLTALLAEHRAGPTPPLEIHLAPLDIPDVAALLRDTLTDDNVTDLARELVQRTHGNPLFIREFLRFLHRERLLHHDPARGAWTWDLASVDAARVPASIADLLGDALRRQPPEVQHILQLAACLGTRFDATTLAQVHGAPLSELARLLQPAVEQGHVVPLHPSFRLLAHARADELEQDVPLRFLHDRVRQAAYALIPEPERPTFHAQVGRRLLARAYAHGQLHETLFDIVTHLNAAIPLLAPGEQSELAELDLLAARRAKATAAYESALTLLAAGLAALGHDAWRREPALAFDLHAEQAECEYLSGALDRALARLEHIEPHAATSVQRLQLIDLRVVLHASMGNTRAALQAGRLGLATAGIELPEDPTACRLAVADELARIDHLLARTPLAALVDAPPLRDPAMRGVLKLLADMLAPANLTHPDLYALINTTQARLSIEHGHTDISAYTYVVYGFFLATVLRQYPQADQFGRFALELNDRLDNPALRCRLRFVYATYSHFTRPLRSVLAEFSAALDDGREAGDHIYSASACSHILISRISLGDPLAEVHEQADRLLALTQRTRVSSAAATQTVARQLVSALRGRNLAPHSLADEHFDEHAFVARCERSGMTFALRWYATASLLLALLFDRGADARALIDRFGPAIAGNFGFYFTTEFAFLAALALTRLAADAPPDERPARLAELATYADPLAAWALACPANFAHRAALVAAERAALTGDDAAAITAYDAALEAARAAGLVAHEALTCELAARFHRQRGRAGLARLLLREAHDAYRRWGATSKLRALHDAHPELATPPGTSAPFVSDEQHADLDLRSILRASQAFAAALRLDELTRTVLRIVVVTAGATHGVLVLADDHEPLRVVGTWAAHGATPAQDERDLDTHPTVPAAPVRLAYRTLRPVAQSDPEHAGLFPAAARSALCLPLVVQGQAHGVLYLENNLAAGAFTPARRETLAMLSAQIAVSLAHAKLYARLDEARSAAEAASRAKSTFLANMSHELRTPLNAILGYADLIEEETAPDTLLADDIRKIQRASRHLLDIISDILDLSKIEAEKLDVLLQPFPLVPLLAGVIETIGPAIARNHNTLVYNPTPELGSMYSDPVRLRQVLLNLLSNAAKFTQQGTITLVAERQDERIRVTVQDTGIGMTPAQADRVFDAFHQVDASTTRQVGGTGLGLTISRRLCQLLGGDITLRTTPGEGSSFTIDLPARAEPQPRPAIA